MSNKLVMILVGVLLVLVLGMGGGMFVIWNKLSVLSAQAAPAAETDPGSDKAKPEPGKVISLDTFIVNLADPGGNRYLRVTMDLEVSGKQLEEELPKRIPQIRDAVLMILPTKRFEDVHRTEGKTALREELLGAMNSLLTSGKVSRIFFKEFVIQ
jgi:flagellar protein FliL